MRKSLLVSTLLSSFLVHPAVASSESSSIKAKLEGLIKFQSGFLHQKSLSGADAHVSGNRKGFAFYTDAAVMLTLSNTTDNNFTYGAKVTLQPTTKASGSVDYNGSHLFIETDYGKIEAGAPYDAASKLRITGYDIAAATGDDWSRYAKLESKNIKYKGVVPEFVTSEDYFFNTVFKTDLKQINDKTEPSRKISYYTPKMSGFQFGVSYIPDTSNTGTSSVDKVSSGVSEVTLAGGDKNILKVDRNFKDAFAAGISYEYKIADDVNLKLAATGEYGKAAGKATEIIDKGLSTEREGAKYKLSGIKTYNLGAVLSYGNFSYAASYGNLGKSLTSKGYNKTGRNTIYYNGAVAYGQGPIKVSVAYFKSNQYKNTVDAVSIGTEYKLVPGLVPYVEVAYFQAKGRPSHYPKAPKKKAKGTVVLIGTKLKF